MTDFGKLRKNKITSYHWSHMTALILLAGFCLILLVFQVIVSNRLVSLGNTVTGIEQNIEQITQANNILREAIASDSSLMVLESKAKQIGFTKAIRPVFINLDHTVALDLR